MSGLTMKEGQVIHLIAAGYVSKQIAAELGVDEETVESRLRRAMHRLGARTRSQLVAVYLRGIRKGVRSQVPAEQLLLVA